MDAKVKTETKNGLLNLDDLLQCPVCYEVPAGQIFQCNEGHHVCAGCKSRLHNCPVCRSLFFGTRNYAMEELLANIRKLKAFKSAAGTATVEIKPNMKEEPSEILDTSSDSTQALEISSEGLSQSSRDMFNASRGMWRCFIVDCGERIPLCRLINHLRYYHRNDLLEVQMENMEYKQAWDIPLDTVRSVNAIAIRGVGVFWLTFEVADDEICAWLTVANNSTVSVYLTYVLTLAAGQREVMFKDCVRSSREAEGSLKKNRRMLRALGEDAREMLAAGALRLRLRVLAQAEEEAPEAAVLLERAPEQVLRIAARPNGAAPASPPPLRPAERIGNAEELEAQAMREVQALVRTLRAEGRSLREREGEGREEREEPPAPSPSHSPPAPRPAAAARRDKRSRRRHR